MSGTVCEKITRLDDRARGVDVSDCSLYSDDELNSEQALSEMQKRPLNQTKSAQGQPSDLPKPRQRVDN